MQTEFISNEKKDYALDDQGGNSDSFRIMQSFRTFLETQYRPPTLDLYFSPICCPKTTFQVAGTGVYTTDFCLMRRLLSHDASQIFLAKSIYIPTRL